MAAPVTAILGMEINFFEELPKLFPHADAKSWFKDLPQNVLEAMARTEQLPAGGLLHAGRPLAGPRLRTHVGLR